MLEDVIFVLKDFLLWARRRLFLLAYSATALSIMVPFQAAKLTPEGSHWRWLPAKTTIAGLTMLKLFVKAIFDRAHGNNWFADPLGKPGLFQYGVELMAFALGTVFLRTKKATEDAYAATKSASIRGSGDGVTVVLMEDYLEFQSPQQRDPAETDAKGDRSLVGVIIIPGALISPFAYSILARDLARKGYPSFVLRLPFDLAFYGWSTAGRIIKRPHKQGQVPAPTKWVLLGHSLGASGVQRFTDARPECVDGMVFLGGGHLIAGNLAKLDIPSLLIWGSRDPFTPTKMLQKAKKKMPMGADSVVIPGGNHRGFASYSRQALDWEATITPEEQRQKTVEALVEFIEQKVVP